MTDFLQWQITNDVKNLLLTAGRQHSYRAFQQTWVRAQPREHEILLSSRHLGCIRKLRNG